MSGLTSAHEGNSRRDVIANFSDRSKTSHGATALFNSLHDEARGDRLQSSHLINCFNGAVIKNQNKSVMGHELKIDNNELIALTGEDYSKVLGARNETLGVVIGKCYNDFVVIGKLIADRVEVVGMAHIHKEQLRSRCNAMLLMLGFIMSTQFQDC